MARSRTIYSHHEGFMYGRDALLRVRYCVCSSLQILRTPQRAHGPAAAVPYHFNYPSKLEWLIPKTHPGISWPEWI